MTLIVFVLVVGITTSLVGWVHSERTRRLVAFALLIIFGGVVLISVSTYLEKRYTGVLRVVIHSRPVEK
jgi:hypothetical protein